MSKKPESRDEMIKRLTADFAEAEQLFRLKAISRFGDGDHPNRSGATLAGSIIDQLACSVNAESFFLIDSPVISTL